MPCRQGPSDNAGNPGETAQANGNHGDPEDAADCTSPDEPTKRVGARLHVVHPWITGIRFVK